MPVLKTEWHLKKHTWSKNCKATTFEALKLGDLIPGKGKNKYQNFIYFLAGK